MNQRDLILIIDFGSQYTQLIARRIREFKVYSEIHPHTITFDEVKNLQPKGIILSGGPMSVYDESAPAIDPQIFNLKIPFLGLCYGLQLICKNFGGTVEPATSREYGKSILRITDNTDILQGVEDASIVWMSHGDYLTELPKGFKVVGESDHSPICAISNPSKRVYGLQFHPEVVHTEDGEKIINNFLSDICKCNGDWTPQNFIEEKLEKIKSTIGNSKAICALSGGVDSTVAAVLVRKAIGDNLICIHIDNGLMRKNESEKIGILFNEKLKLNHIHVDASEKFLK